MELPCAYCETPVRRSPSKIPKSGRVFCNNTCKGAWQREGLKGEDNPNFGKGLFGEDNPNFGNRWSPEQRKQASARATEQMRDPTQREMAGRANRGKKFSPELVHRMHVGRSPESYSRPHTDEAKVLIGKKSAEKWTPEYRRRHRQKMEEIGRWVPLEEKPAYAVYSKEANWVASMLDFVSIEETGLLKTLGMWHFSSNRGGVVRDHMYPRRSGFEARGFPEILRHPCNCQVITHSENVSKAQKGKKDREDQTLDQLFTRIEEFSGDWPEQATCVALISSYRQGSRWER